MIWNKRLKLVSNQWFGREQRNVWGLRNRRCETLPECERCFLYQRSLKKKTGSQAEYHFYHHSSWLYPCQNVTNILFISWGNLGERYASCKCLFFFNSDDEIMLVVVTLDLRTRVRLRQERREVQGHHTCKFV